MQRMLNDGAVQTGEGIAIEMGRLAVHLADGEQRVIGLVLEHPLLAAVQPGDVGDRSARDGIAIRRPSGNAILVNA